MCVCQEGFPHLQTRVILKFPTVPERVTAVILAAYSSILLEWVWGGGQTAMVGKRVYLWKILGVG